MGQIKTVVLALCAASLVACTSSWPDTGRLTKGMTEDEVVHVMAGEPNSKITHENMLYYNYDIRKHTNRFKGHYKYIIRFVDGKTDRFGRGKSFFKKAEEEAEDAPRMKTMEKVEKKIIIDGPAKK